MIQAMTLGQLIASTRPPARRPPRIEIDPAEFTDAGNDDGRPLPVVHRRPAPQTLTTVGIYLTILQALENLPHAAGVRVGVQVRPGQNFHRLQSHIHTYAWRQKRRVSVAYRGGVVWIQRRDG